jgi:predicted nucleic acid-binding Zn ribbon protein
MPDEPTPPTVPESPPRVCPVDGNAVPNDAATCPVCGNAVP